MNAITTTPGGSKLTTLGAIEQARQRLAEASTLEDVLAIEDYAEAATALLECAAKGSEAHAEAWALVQETERKLGEITSKIPQAKRGPKAPEVLSDHEEKTPPVENKTAVLKRMGVSPQVAARAERIAALDDDEFHARRDNGKGKIKSGKPAAPVDATSSAVGYDGDEASTPELYADAARRALGGRIGLDVACNAYAANVIRPERFFTKEDDALDKSWETDTLFMNSPYSPQLIRAFVDKFLSEHAAQHFDAAIVLVNASVETEWFQSLLNACSLVCFPNKRIQFEYKGEPIQGSNRYAQAFFYFGQKQELFSREFKGFGAILSPLRGFF